MVFTILFVISYMLTRLFQGALRSTILPKTKMDQGGQTALVAGVGYVGETDVLLGQHGRVIRIDPRTLTFE